ncbi:acyl-CoA dehydrogenase family protein [Pseudonocardia ailaonensis]|uniref:Acyl-CoA dehydrogenase family protein n=1 Tax=Pseudonocardia ailaonensis TaxID=367279 RepID=A0ABN2N1F2_9PSEU
MNFAPIEETPELRRLAEEYAELLGADWSPSPLELSLDHDRPDVDLVERFAERGWMSPENPPEQGGAGLGPVEARLLHLLHDEFRVPEYDNNLIVPTLRKHGSPRLHAEILPGLESGRATFSLGYSEPDSGSDMAAARTRAVRDGDDWVINGSKMFTTWAETSDYLFMLARTGTVEEKHAGLTVFLVPMSSEGIEVRAIHVMGHVRTNVTYYRNVRIPDDFRIGEVGAGWAVVAEPLAAEHGAGAALPLADLNGVMAATFTRVLERLVERTVDWAVAAGPDGTSPIDDPEVRNRLLDAIVDIEVCWAAPGDYGKVVAAGALQHHADRLLDLTAPWGLLSAGTPGSAVDGLLAWARDFAPAADVYGGTSEIYRNNLARRSLGLPRPR